MKLFVAVLVLAVGSSYGLFIDELIDNVPLVCKADGDCGEERCCAKFRGSGLFGRGVCAPKLGANMRCDGLLHSLHGCGCRKGLECKVTRTVNVTIDTNVVFTKVFKRCKPAEEVVVPEEAQRDISQHKRFIDLGLLKPVIKPVDNLFGKFVRKCSGVEDSSCGSNRCCLRYPVFGHRCTPTLPYRFPCISGYNDHCCGEGMVCKTTVNINVGNGEDDKDVFKFKTCQKLSDPVTPVEEIDIDE